MGRVDGGGLVTLSAADAARTTVTALLPLVAQGMIKRRPLVLGLAERLDTNRGAVRSVQRLRRRYGLGPLVLRLPGRRLVLPLTAADVEKVLTRSPEPFTPANREKRAALGRFEPHGVLVSDPADRPGRRRLNEAVLTPDRAVHPMARSFGAVVEQEMAAVEAAARRRGVITWKDWEQPFWRVVRRVVLGDGAADDDDLLDLLSRLRREANWAYLRPAGERRTAQLRGRIQAYLDRAEPGSLAELTSRMPADGATAPADQVPQWLFAFDAAAMTAFRTLALLGSHPAQQARVRDELAGLDLAGNPELPYLRACLQDTLRLWPTTPVILRDATCDLSWSGGTVPAGSAVAVFAPFLHRDDETLPWADRFDPGIWLDGTALASWTLLPFSAGPVVCPGRNLVLFLTSTMLARILQGRHVLRLPGPGPQLGPGRPLPGTLSPFRLRLGVQPA